MEDLHLCVYNNTDNSAVLLHLLQVLDMITSEKLYRVVFRRDKFLSDNNNCTYGEGGGGG